MALCHGFSRLPLHLSRYKSGCHGLVPWRFTLAATPFTGTNPDAMALGHGGSRCSFFQAHLLASNVSSPRRKAVASERSISCSTLAANVRSPRRKAVASERSISCSTLAANVRPPRRKAVASKGNLPDSLLAANVRPPRHKAVASELEEDKSEAVSSKSRSFWSAVTCHRFVIESND